MKPIFILFSLCILLFTTSCKPKAEEASVTTETPKEKGNDFAINTSLSELKWEAFQPLGGHEGIIPIREGVVIVENGNVTGGKVIFDVKNLRVTDLEGEDKQNLEEHLRSDKPGKEDDFFNVSKYPNASFVVTNVTPLSGDPEGTHSFTGDLTLRDITKPVTFKANVDLGAVDAVKITGGPFTIDRTEWGIKFRSKKFFDDLKDDFVNDEVKLQFTIGAMR